MLTTETGPPAPALRLWNKSSTGPACRLCGTKLHDTLIDLGQLPLANRTVDPDALPDPLYPLHVRICDNCTLVQLADVAEPKNGAAPRPSRPVRSAVCVTQTKRYAEALRKRLHLDAGSLVIEIGVTDGTFLPHFQAAGVPVLAIEAAGTDTGLPTETGRFDTETAMQIAVRHGCADLVIANDVLPLAPNLFDFAAGLASILRPNGVLTLQVPHLLSLVQKIQFDAFRHDTYTYLSLKVLEHVLRSVGLRVFDAERVPDHAGSLRVQACHAVGPYAARPGLKAVRLAERIAEQDGRDFFAGFGNQVAAVRNEIQDFLRTRRIAGRRVAAYGAATRGTTLLNACGITPQEIACVADPDPKKHGRLLPGSRIPIVPIETLIASPPHDLIILPWPYAAEIALKLQPLRSLGSQLWTAIPRIMRA